VLAPVHGDGSATVANETAPIHEGDAVPIQLNEAHSFQNTGNQPLEFLIVGVSRDNSGPRSSESFALGRGTSRPTARMAVAR